MAIELLVEKKGMANLLHIKNMVCPRCISAVSKIFEDLNIKVISIDLGSVQTENHISDSQKSAIEIRLKEDGFELLTDSNSKLIDRIKSIIIEEIHHKSTSVKINFSKLLSEELNKDYSSSSKLFSAVEGQTIEQFVLNQKIEKVKELLFYNEYSLSEIAHQLNYSSTAHLSAQFKKITGMSPTAFKKLKSNIRKPLDSI